MNRVPDLRVGQLEDLHPHAHRQRSAQLGHADGQAVRIGRGELIAVAPDVGQVIERLRLEGGDRLGQRRALEREKHQGMTQHEAVRGELERRAPILSDLRQSHDGRPRKDEEGRAGGALPRLPGHR